MSKFVSARARFSGTLNNISVQDLGGLDFDKDKLIDRIDEVTKKLEETKGFFDEYFFSKEKDDYDNGEFDYLITDSDKREYYRYSPNSIDELAQDINICKYLQMYGTYLLSSKDLKKEKMQEYTLLTEEEFKKQLNKELATDFKADANTVLDTRSTNDYNNINLKINKQDLNPYLQTNKYGIRDKDLYLAKVLNNYQTLREHIKSEMEKLKIGETSYLSLYQMKSLLSTLIGDMHDAKNMILGIRSQAKRLGDETPYNDYSTLDYGNTEHIKACLKFCPLGTPKPDVDISHIGYDLLVAIETLRKNKKIDNLDMEIIESYNSGNYTIREIASEIDRQPNVVTQRLNKICKRIVEVI